MIVSNKLTSQSFQNKNMKKYILILLLKKKNKNKLETWRDIYNKKMLIKVRNTSQNINTLLE